MKKDQSRLRNENRREPVQSSEGRESRDLEDVDRNDDKFAMSQEDRERMLREDALQNQLPTPPKRPGVHWFWASLTNTYTTVAWYQRMGYRAVRMEDPLLKGWADENMRGKSGDFAGCITVNEMLLMKADEASYQRFMQIVHHEKPMQEQEGVRSRVQETKDAVAGETGKDGLVTDAAAPGEASGFRELERRAKRPSRFQ